METVEIKDLVGLTEDDERFVKQTKELFHELRRSVYQKVCAICEIDKAAEVLCEDDKRTLQELREKWADWHAFDLTLDDPKTLNEYQPGVAEDLVNKLEGLLGQFLPACQSEVLEKLAERLPKRLADEELEQLRDAAGDEVVNAVMANISDVRLQVVMLRRLREAVLKVAELARKSPHAKTE
jgi:hypothetical protein